MIELGISLGSIPKLPHAAAVAMAVLSFDPPAYKESTLYPPDPDAFKHRCKGRSRTRDDYRAARNRVHKRRAKKGYR